MRLSSHIPHRPHPTTAASGFAGRDDPLMRTAEWRRVVRRDALALLGLLAAGATLLAARVPAAASLIGVTAAGLALAALAHAGLRSSERARARALILEGRAVSASPAFDRECRRLRKRCPHLADNLEVIAATADRPRWLVRGSRPLFRVNVVAAVVPQLRELAELLRREHAPLRGVVLVTRLLEEGDSALYGDDPVQLAEILGRIRFALASPPGGRGR